MGNSRSACRAFGLAILAVALTCAPGAAQTAAARPPLDVRVAFCGSRHIDATLLEKAKRIADDVYRALGVELSWGGEDCAAQEIGFLLNITSSKAVDPALADVAIGFAEPGSSVATVLYDRAASFARRYRVKREVLLGYTMAHELGHLLLPPNSHSWSGVMRPSLDLEEAARRKLRFTREQGALIVHRLEDQTAAGLQNALEAMRAPSAIAANLPQTTSGSTAAWPTHVP